MRPQTAEPSHLRIFAAVPLPAQCIQNLKEIQGDLKSVKAQVKWVLPENCHMTLKFFGNVRASKIANIKDIMDSCTKDLSAFPMTIDHIGAFPTIKHPQIIWIGSHKGQDQLKNLTEKLELNLAEAGFAKETRPFNAHITIGRTKSDHEAHVLSSKITTMKIDAINIQINSIALYQSVLSSKDPVYSVIHRSLLK